MNGIGRIDYPTRGPVPRRATSPMQAADPVQGTDPTQAASSAMRSLVPVAPVAEAVSTGDLPRPAAALLAQLMAVRENLPQARRLRRAAPAEAIAAYEATAALGNPSPGPSAERRL